MGKTPLDLSSLLAPPRVSSLSARRQVWSSGCRWMSSMNCSTVKRIYKEFGKFIWNVGCHFFSTREKNKSRMSEVCPLRKDRIFDDNFLGDVIKLLIISGFAVNGCYCFGMNVITFCDVRVKKFRSIFLFGEMENLQFQLFGVKFGAGVWVLGMNCSTRKRIYGELESGSLSEIRDVISLALVREISQWRE